MNYNKLVLCTQGGHGISTLRKLFELGYLPNQIYIVTDDNSGNDVLIEFLKYYNMNYKIYKNDMKSLADWIKKNEVKFLLSVSYRYIFDKNIFEIENLLCVNLHPGILPDYRGCFSIPWAIINGEKYTGFTYHIINEGIDSGKIIYQDKIDIDYEKDTAHSLHYSVMNRAINALDNVLVKEISLCENTISKGKYYKNELPYSGLINEEWNEDKIDRFIKAMIFPPFESAVLNYEDRKYVIEKISQYKNIILEG